MHTLMLGCLRFAISRKIPTLGDRPFEFQSNRNFVKLPYDHASWPKADIYSAFNLGSKWLEPSKDPFLQEGWQVFPATALLRPGLNVQDR